MRSHGAAVIRERSRTRVDSQDERSQLERLSELVPLALMRASATAVAQQVAVDGRFEEDQVEEGEHLEREREVHVCEVAARSALHQRGVAGIRVLHDCPEPRCERSRGRPRRELMRETYRARGPSPSSSRTRSSLSSLLVGLSESRWPSERSRRKEASQLQRVFGRVDGSCRHFVRPHSSPFRDLFGSDGEEASL